MVRIVATQEFLAKLKRLKKDHKQLILKDIRKLRTQRMNAIKILNVAGPYVLGEIKHKKPPYRLYVVIDQEAEICAVVEWAHKKEQREIIEKLRRDVKKLMEGLLGSI